MTYVCKKNLKHTQTKIEKKLLKPLKPKIQSKTKFNQLCPLVIGAKNVINDFSDQ